MKASKGWEADLDRKLRSRFSVSLMNDTKWREVWALVIGLKLRIQMSYASQKSHSSDASLWGPFSADLLGENGIRDPGVGGPFLFKEILWMRIPKMQRADVALFRAELEKLGRLPLSDNDQYIEILGYAAENKPA